MLQKLKLLARFGIVCPYCYSWRWTSWVLGAVDFEDFGGQFRRVCRRCGEEQWRSFGSPPRNRMSNDDYQRYWHAERREELRQEFDAETWGEFRQ
jgi:hypothetical protein